MSEGMRTVYAADLASLTISRTCGVSASSASSSRVCGPLERELELRQERVVGASLGAVGVASRAASSAPARDRGDGRRPAPAPSRPPRIAES